MMNIAVQGFRVPNITLERVGGGVINPSALLGQKLVVIFCPSDPAAAAREIESYRALADAFEEQGVWILGVLADGIDPPSSGPGEPSIALLRDPAGAAWAAFHPGLPEPLVAGRGEGATFLFEQWGCLGHGWTGSGHAKEVLQEARRRS